jgi:hypothetical protein
MNIYDCPTCNIATTQPICPKCKAKLEFFIGEGYIEGEVKEEKKDSGTEDHEYAVRSVEMHLANI